MAMPSKMYNYCFNCGTDLSHRPRKPIYCNDVCRHQFHSKVKRYVLSRSNNKKLYICEHPNCDEKFIPKRPDQRFCQVSCRKSHVYYTRLANNQCPRCGNIKLESEQDLVLCNICRKKCADYEHKRIIKNPKRKVYCLYCEKDLSHVCRKRYIKHGPKYGEGNNYVYTDTHNFFTRFIPAARLISFNALITQNRKESI